MHRGGPAETRPAGGTGLGRAALCQAEAQAADPQRDAETTLCGQVGKFSLS